MKKVLSAALVASVAAFVVACGGDAPPPATPDTVPTTPATSDMPAPPATTAEPTPPPAKTAEEAPKPPPAPKLSELLGGVTKVTGATPKDKAGKPSKTWTKAGDIEAFVKAVGADQSADGAKPAGDAAMTIEMMDKDGKVKGTMMLFNGETLSAAFMAPGGEAKAIKIADEAAVRKISGVAKPKAAVPAKPPAKKK
jgi:hypothetical protein